MLRFFSLLPAPSKQVRAVDDARPEPEPDRPDRHRADGTTVMERPRLESRHSLRRKWPLLRLRSTGGGALNARPGSVNEQRTPGIPARMVPRRLFRPPDPPARHQGNRFGCGVVWTIRVFCRMLGLEPRKDAGETLARRRTPMHDSTPVSTGFDPGAVPGELRLRPQWVGWRFESRNGKTTKRPLAPANGRAAKINDPRTWGSFKAAGALVASGGADGVGYVFTADDPYVGIDLDDAVVCGEISDWAREIVAALDSYTEISPSGSGLHVLVRAPGFCPPLHRIGPVEVYTHARYFTMTGQVLQDRTAIQDREPQLVAWMNGMAAPPATTTETAGTPARKRATPGPMRDEDHTLIEQCRRNARFTALYDHGDRTAYGNDDSRADLALLSILVHEMIRMGLEPAPDQLDRVFRSSALARPKWDRREDYRTATIELALQCGDRAEQPDRRDEMDRPRLPDERASELLSTLPRMLAYCRPRSARLTAHALAIEFLAAESRGDAAPYPIWQHDLAEKTGQHRNTISRHLAALQQHGLIQLHVRPAKPGAMRKKTLIAPVGSALDFARRTSTRQ
jgi:hypothetical protein